MKTRRPVRRLRTAARLLLCGALVAAGSTGAQAQILDCPPWNVSHWWELNREHFLPQPPRPPLAGERRAEVGAALRTALHDTGDQDLIEACAFALARIGAQDLPFDLQGELLPLLAASPPRVRETVALGLGIGGDPGALLPLCALVRDEAEGRRLVARDVVDRRTRAFALHGLGFLAQYVATPAVQDEVVRIAAHVLQNAADDDVDLHVAAISALSLLAAPAGSRSWPQCAAAVTVLETFSARSGEALARARAHVPTAIARLVTTSRAGGRSDAEPAALGHRKHWLRVASAGEGRPERDDFERQSALLALAAATPDDEAEGARTTAMLAAVARDASDPACRYLATLALGRCAASGARTPLLALLRDAEPLQRAWAALALGLGERGLRTRDHAALPDAVVAAALLEAMAAANAELAAAAALGLALSDADCREPLARLLGHASEVVRASAAEALAIRGDRAAIPELRALFAAADRHPSLRRAAARALQVLGDEEIVGRLVAAVDAASLAQQCSACLALGDSRDPAAVDVLLARLRDRTAAPLARAFAAEALGLAAAHRDGIAALACGTNWIAAPATLQNRRDGVLDHRAR